MTVVEFKKADKILVKQLSMSYVVKSKLAHQQVKN